MSDPDRWAPTASVEQVLYLVDRQIETVLRHGVLAVESDVLPQDRPATVALLRELPVGIWSALVTEVSRRGRCTVVKTRFMSTNGSFTLVTAWDLGPNDRPWIVRLATRHRTFDYVSAARSAG